MHEGASLGVQTLPLMMLANVYSSNKNFPLPSSALNLRDQLHHTSSLLNLPLCFPTEEPRPHDHGYLRNPPLAQHLRVA